MSLQPKRHLDQFRHFCTVHGSAHQLTDRDHAICRAMCLDKLHLCSVCRRYGLEAIYIPKHFEGRPNNVLASLSWNVELTLDSREC